ncbi:MAG: hypothetical protein GX148_01595 [Clostridiales bacterium]|nr:hypothetical protein [Clostridiales bacterium]
MFSKMGYKILVMSFVISMVSGLIAGMVVVCADRKTSITSKCKKAFKQLEDRMM